MTDANDSGTSNITGSGTDGTSLVDSIPVSYTESFETLKYHPETGAYRSYFDTRVDTPSLAVISAVAALTGETITDLEPLHLTVDPDALDKLWGGSGESDQSKSQISFTFADHEITLSRGGLLTIRSEGTETSPAPS